MSYKICFNNHKDNKDKIMLILNNKTKQLIRMRHKIKNNKICNPKTNYNKILLNKIKIKWK
jgi:hypothetical protein